MTKITVEIDCELDLCGPCHGLGFVALVNDLMNSPVCGIFNVDLAIYPESQKDGTPNAYRCPECYVAVVRE
jgi:hypothetical protein